MTTIRYTDEAMRADLVLRAWADHLFESFRGSVQATIHYRKEGEALPEKAMTFRLPDARPATIMLQRDVQFAYVIVDPMWSPV